jgi:hypothetical protein
LGGGRFGRSCGFRVRGLRALSAGSAAQSCVGQREDVGIGTGRGDRKADAAHAAGELGADLEQPEPDDQRALIRSKRDVDHLLPFMN